MYDNIWLKRVWIPFWVIQLLILLILVVSVGIGFGVLRENKSELQGDLQDDGYGSDDFHEAYSTVR